MPNANIDHLSLTLRVHAPRSHQVPDRVFRKRSDVLVVALKKRLFVISKVHHYTHPRCDVWYLAVGQEAAHASWLVNAVDEVGLEAEGMVENEVAMGEFVEFFVIFDVPGWVYDLFLDRLGWNILVL